MTPERWQQVKQIFQSAIERPADERAAFIRSECDGDESLAAEIESLFAAAGRFSLALKGWLVIGRLFCCMRYNSDKRSAQAACS